MEEAVLDFHFTYFRTEWITRSEAAFQEFFEAIMSRADETFVKVATAGSHGDKKSDGYRTGDQSIFQVYAPSSGLKSGPTCTKINEDFAGAKALWPAMERWVFVWSSPRGGLPPDAAKLIGDLDSEHPAISVRQWGQERLWREVRGLCEADRNELLRAFPSVAHVSDPCVAADVASLLNSVSAMPRVSTPSDLTLTAPQEKLSKNKLGPATELLVQTAIGLVPTVAHVASAHPDPGFADRVAAALRALYEMRSADHDDPDMLFLQLIKDVAASSVEADEHFWAAAAIVTRSFEICDVFEP